MAYCGFHPYLENTSDHALLLPPAPLLHAQKPESQACCPRVQGSEGYERGWYPLCLSNSRYSVWKLWHVHLLLWEHCGVVVPALDL